MKTSKKVIALVGIALCSACSEKTTVQPKESAVTVMQTPQPEPKSVADNAPVQTVMPQPQATHQR